MTSGQNTNTITLRYFAWVREKVGLAEEEVSLPADVATVGELMKWLQARGETYQAAFAKPEIIRAPSTRLMHAPTHPSAAPAKSPSFRP